MAQYLSRKRKGRTSINSVPPFLRFVSVTPFDVDNLRSDLICHYSSSILSRKQTKYSGKQSKEIDPILSAQFLILDWATLKNAIFIPHN